MNASQQTLSPAACRRDLCSLLSCLISGDVDSAAHFGGRFIQGAGSAIRACSSALVATTESFARRAPLRFALLTVAALLAVLCAVFIPSFQSNDDPQLMMIASGKGACQQPDEHLVFTNVLIGHALKTLYTAFPATPWYGLYLYFAQYLGQVAILYCALASGYTRLRVALCLVFFTITEVFLFNNLQFTMTAALVGQGGALVCLLALRRRTLVPNCRVLGLLASGVALLCLASLIRLECFYLIAIVALPAAVCLMGWPLRRAVLAPTLGTAAVCLSMVLACAAYNDACYARDRLWRGFFDYNQVRIKFNDYAWVTFSSRTAHVFEQVEWSENDHTMIVNWFYADPDLYGKANLQHLVESYPWRNQRLTAAYWRDWLSTLWNDKSVWSIGLVLPLFLGCHGWGRRGLWACAASGAMALTLLGCLAVFNKVPPSRVYFPVLMFPLGLSLVMARDRAALPPRGSPGLALCCLLSPACWWQPRTRLLLLPAVVDLMLILTVVGVIYSVKPQLRRSGKMEFARQQLLDYVECLNPRSDQLYVVWAPGFPYEVISPLDNLHSFSNLHQLVLGWPQHTPIFDAMKQRFGVDNVSRALYERSDVFLLGHDSFHPLYQNFVREHYDVDVRFASSHPNPYTAYVAGNFQLAPEAQNTVAGQGDSGLPRR